jgi:hypothetical protein
VTTGLPHLRLRTSAALALSLLAMLLVAPTIAQGRKSACASRSHARRGAHACATHGRKARHTSTDRRHHGGHGAVRSLPPARLAPASDGATGACEYASAPLSGAGQAAPTCSNAGGPACTDSSGPTSAGSGEAAVPCSAPTEHDGGAGEATCEDAAGQPCDPPEEAGESPCEEVSPAASGEGPSFVCEG